MNISSCKGTHLKVSKYQNFTIEISKLVEVANKKMTVTPLKTDGQEGWGGGL